MAEQLVRLRRHVVLDERAVRKDDSLKWGTRWWCSGSRSDRGASGRAGMVSYLDSTRLFRLRRGESLLKVIERWTFDGYFLGNGTATVRLHFKRHDQVVIVTDEQVVAATGTGRC